MPGAAAQLFRQAFGAEPEFAVRAPGRVNLIGEHTDYNDGFVLPAAIDLELELAGRAREGSRLDLRSVETPEPASFELAQPEASGWGRYAAGVALAMKQAGLPLKAFEGAVAGSLPPGAGLSSSAALELAVARALAHAAGVAWDGPAMARLCQRAENEYVGNRCGIMDQLAVALGRAGHALLIDCRTLAVDPVPVPADLAIVVCDSARPRRLVESAYNERRAECEEAARLLGLPALRDATPESIEAAGLPPRLAGRARHVVAENGRVLALAAALRTHDHSAAGRLMYASHESLRELFEVSSREPDLLVELAAGLSGCFGSRLTGAGFGGCTVSLVAAGRAESFARALSASYRERTGLSARVWICQAVNGVSVNSL